MVLIPIPDLICSAYGDKYLEQLSLAGSRQELHNS